MIKSIRHKNAEDDKKATLPSVCLVSNSLGIIDITDLMRADKDSVYRSRMHFNMKKKKKKKKKKNKKKKRVNTT